MTIHAHRRGILDRIIMCCFLWPLHWNVEVICFVWHPIQDNHEVEDEPAQAGQVDTTINAI